MKVITRTCTRIDFAGGTLDLYPLYLFMGGGVTVNGSIDLFSRVEMETRLDGAIEIISEDLEEKAFFRSIDEMPLEGPTSLIQRAVKSYAPQTGLSIGTRNLAPKGSGLGASSSLLMALSAALIAINKGSVDVTDMIDRGAAIEAAHLGIPTGKQDYYGAVLGGINALYFDECGCTPENIPMTGSFGMEMENSLIISFTGISHYSGDNNWDMFKKFIDRSGVTYEMLLKIRDIAFQTWDALESHDPEKLGFLVGREWECRKALSGGVSNDFIDGAIEAARRAGAWGSKLCGAGGGGCMITLTPPSRRMDVEKALKSSGVEIMNTQLDLEGLDIQEAVSV